jgi:hypothetical protein
MKNRTRQLRTCGSVRGEGREALTYSEVLVVTESVTKRPRSCDQMRFSRAQRGKKRFSVYSDHRLHIIPAGHIGNTFRYLRETQHAVAGVFQSGRTHAVRGQVAGRREDGGFVPSVRLSGILCSEPVD